jgi:polysaccharide biosynthesis protein PslH
METKKDNQTVKVLSIVPAPLYPAVSGGQKGTYGNLDAMGRIGRLVSITDTLSTPIGHSFELRPLIPHNSIKYFSLRNYSIILKQVKELKPSVILLEQPFMGPMIQLISKKTSVPFFQHAHNLEFLRFKSLGRWWWPLMYIWERYTMRRAKGVFFVTDEDRQLAIQHFKLSPHKCFLKPYGIPQTKLIKPETGEREKVLSRHGINPSDKIFMFFGVLKYLPNIEALEFIIDEIRPRLLKKLGSGYKIIICGGGLSDDYQKTLRNLDKDHIRYIGFVEDIDEYTRSSDVVLNPVLKGGGVKTKVVEAIGLNKPVVSTATGALGINPLICGNKLQIVDDENWNQFTDCMIEALSLNGDTPQEFYENYSWDGIARNMYKILVRDNE